MAADRDALGRILGDARAGEPVLLARRALLRTLEWEAFCGPVFAGSAEVVRYLHASIAHSAVEQVRGLFLDAANRLLREELLFAGTIDQAPMYRREVVRRALDLNAAGLILVHNHPSGDPEPSETDILVTKDIARTLSDVGVRLHDHLVIARTGWRSIRIDHV